MAIKFRKYNPSPLFGDDYYALRNFLLKLDNPTYLFGRWDWMISHGYLDKSGLPKIGLWEADGNLAAVATYDCRLGEAFLLTAAGHENLKEEMLLYAKDAFEKDGKFKVLILDSDMEMQETASRNGFYPTQGKECDAVYPIMWQDSASQSALVEPVATDPAYRKMGLGKAAVLEAIRRCGNLGAKQAYVGSSQQFYYNIGFRPFTTSTWWEQKQHTEKLL